MRNLYAIIHTRGKRRPKQRVPKRADRTGVLAWIARRHDWLVPLVAIIACAIFLAFWSNLRAGHATFYLTVDSYESVTIDTRIEAAACTGDWPSNAYAIAAQSATLEGPLVLGLLLDAETSGKYIQLKAGVSAQKLAISSSRVFLMSSTLNEGDQISIRLLSWQQADSQGAYRLVGRYSYSMTSCPLTGMPIEAVTIGGIAEGQEFSASLIGEVQIPFSEPQEQFDLGGGLGRSSWAIPPKNLVWAFNPARLGINPFAVVMNLTEGASNSDLGQIMISAKEQLWMVLWLQDKATVELQGVAGKISVNGEEKYELRSIDALKVVTESSPITEVARVSFSEGGIEINGVVSKLVVRRGEEAVNLMPKRGGPSVGDPEYWVSIIISGLIGSLIGRKLKPRCA